MAHRFLVEGSFQHEKKSKYTNECTLVTIPQYNAQIDDIHTELALTKD